MNFPAIVLTIGMAVILFMFAAIVVWLYRLEGIAVKLLRLVPPEKAAEDVPEPDAPLPATDFADAAQALPVEEIATKREAEAQPIVVKPKATTRRKTSARTKRATRAKTKTAEVEA